MLKQLIILLLLSLVVIFGTQYILPLISVVLSTHHWVSQSLLQIFTGGKAGNAIREFIALWFVPLCLTLIPTLIFWLAKRRFFPYFFHTLWVIWLVQTTALIMV